MRKRHPHQQCWQARACVQAPPAALSRPLAVLAQQSRTRTHHPHLSVGPLACCRCCWGVASRQTRQRGPHPPLALRRLDPACWQKANCYCYCQGQGRRQLLQCQMSAALRPASCPAQMPAARAVAHPLVGELRAAVASWVAAPWQLGLKPLSWSWVPAAWPCTGSEKGDVQPSRPSGNADCSAGGGGAGLRRTCPSCFRCSLIAA